MRSTTPHQEHNNENSEDIGWMFLEMHRDDSQLQPLSRFRGGRLDAQVQ